MEEFKNKGTLNMEEFQEDLRNLSEQWQKCKQSRISVEKTLSEIRGVIQ